MVIKNLKDVMDKFQNEDEVYKKRSVVPISPYGAAVKK